MISRLPTVKCEGEESTYPSQLSQHARTTFNKEILVSHTARKVEPKHPIDETKGSEILNELASFGDMTETTSIGPFVKSGYSGKLNL